MRPRNGSAIWSSTRTFLTCLAPAAMPGIALRYVARQRFWVLPVTFMLLFNLPAIGVEPGEQLKNPAREVRAHGRSAPELLLVALFVKMKRSTSPMPASAHDIRILLRERLTAGDNADRQAVKAIVDRYGEFVLLNPPGQARQRGVLWFRSTGHSSGGPCGRHGLATLPFRQHRGRDTTRRRMSGAPARCHPARGRSLMLFTLVCVVLVMAASWLRSACR